MDFAGKVWLDGGLIHAANVKIILVENDMNVAMPAGSFMRQMSGVENALVWRSRAHGPLTRYVKLRVVHAPGMPGTISQQPTWNEAAS